MIPSRCPCGVRLHKPARGPTPIFCSNRCRMAVARANWPQTLTSERLHELLRYDPETGVWRWLLSRGGGHMAGDVAGSVRKDGRRCFKIDGRHYYASRLAWFYMKGSWPKGEVDHHDLDKGNDRWRNLREATHQQNNQNMGARRNSGTGFKGVSLQMNHGRPYAWFVSTTANGKRRWAYCYGTLAEAAALYEQWANELHGDFARIE
jgi:HNH endonuclease/AP2 domain